MMIDPSLERVPNVMPSIEGVHRIAFIGEAPGWDEVNAGVPFVGQSGRLLEGAIMQHGISRAASFVGNLCQIRPPNNVISRFDWHGTEIQSGMRKLREELREFKPHLVVLLGQVPLKAAMDPSTNHPLVPKAFKFKIMDYRGTLFECEIPESPFCGFKCMATLHPAKVLPQRDHDKQVLLQFDMRRASAEGGSAELLLPQRNKLINLNAQQIIDRLAAITEGTVTSIDIEGGIVSPKKVRRKNAETGDYEMIHKPSCVPCLAVSTHPLEAFIIDFGSHPEHEELRILDALSQLCWNPKIPKLFQNGVYDTFVMWWMFKIATRNHGHDTMLSGWELYPELPKALGTQASIWTREPYWKSDLKTQDKPTFLRYCCTDAAVTLEIHERQMEVMTPAQRKHYDFNCSLLPILMYAELRGIRWDTQAAQEAQSTIRTKQMEPWSRIQKTAMMWGAPEHKTQKGVYCNPNSTHGTSGQLPNVLYNLMAYERQYRIEGGKKTNTTTCDKLALLKLMKKNPSDVFLGDILQWKKLDGLRKQAHVRPDADGRIRCSYNPVGTTTGRLSSSEAPTGNGMNLQTLTKSLRHLALADDGYHFFQIDLEGADGWTVACHCKNLVGDSTMLEDYHFGIKPAWVIALMYMLQSKEDRKLLTKEVDSYGENIAFWEREAIRDTAWRFFNKEVADPDLLARFAWLYFASKRVQHGGNYGLGKIQMSNQILQDSYKLASSPIYLPAKDCDALKRLYLGGRYMAVQSWQQWVKTELLEKGTLASASGHIRRFFGRGDDPSVVNAALSHEPQANTTYATNLALRRLWTDPDNRRTDGSLIVEPLHQVHDAICGQFPIAKTEWAKRKLREWMANEIEIAGTRLVIPYEGEYGRSWGEMDAGTIYMEDVA